MENFNRAKEGCIFLSGTRSGFNVHLSLSHTDGFHENNMFTGLKIGQAERKFQERLWGLKKGKGRELK